MRVSAKTDYALRAAVELAAAAGDGTPVKGERLATSQSIPLRFLENILLQLRHAGIDREPPRRRRRLQARPPAGGDHAGRRDPRDRRPAGGRVAASARRRWTSRARSEPLREVWVAVRASLRSVLEQVTLADVAAGELPANVRALTEAPDAWVSH